MMFKRYHSLQVCIVCAKKSISLSLIALALVQSCLPLPVAGELELIEEQVKRGNSLASESEPNKAINNYCISPDPAAKHGPEVRKILKQANFEHLCLKYGNCKLRYMSPYSLKSDKYSEYKRVSREILENRATAVVEADKLVTKWTNELNEVLRELDEVYKSPTSPQRWTAKHKRDRLKYALTYAYFLRAEALRQSARFVESMIALRHLKRLRKTQRGIAIDKIANLENQVINLIVLTFQQDLYKLMNIEPTDDVEAIKVAYETLSGRLVETQEKDTDVETSLCDLVDDMLRVAYNQLIDWVKSSQRNTNKRHVCYVFEDVVF